jgi:wyosine [tRNA(Phe)-imidazoG37] synthetase (radical SAM superfamily)
MSLGVDLVPRKVCSLDCVYCEVGKTTKLTLERKEYIPYAKIVEELSHFFSNNPDPDFITFSGSGEPTLNSRIGDIVTFLKELKPAIPIAVLTNGTLLYDPQVRAELSDVNVVLPSLDAVSADVFAEINRPPANLPVEKYLQGLIDFSCEFSGEIWLEIFILPGCNDGDSEVARMREEILQIRPDSVQINTLDRPGTEADLRGATAAELRSVVERLNLDNVMIIAAAPQRKNIKSYRSDAEAAILETISRRPCTLVDLTQILGMHVNEINKYLDVLEAEGRIETVRQERGFFYQTSGS